MVDDTLRLLRRQIFDRPLACAKDPLAVEPIVYARAQAELAIILEQRNEIMLCAAIDQPNFMFCGVPVISNG